MLIATVVGARPQFVKASVVSAALRRASLDEIMIHTGQHYDPNLSDVFFDELGIPRPDVDLNVGSGSHADQTGRMLLPLERVLQQRAPDVVLLYGDTNSTLAGALVAAKLGIPIAHVEAGVRSYNRRMPEEVNRVITDTLASMLFAPTIHAVENLYREGVPEKSTHLVGDVMYDATLIHGARADGTCRILRAQRLDAGGYVLATVHRAENTDNPVRLRSIFEALSAVATELPVVLPLHPRTRGALSGAGLLAQVGKKVKLIPPVGYLEMLSLEKHAKVIATDSGGIQKEAFFCGVPCVTFRTETEWVELVKLRWNVMVAPDDSAAIRLAVLSATAPHTGPAENPYGDGNASDRIVNVIAQQPTPKKSERSGQPALMEFLK